MVGQQIEIPQSHPEPGIPPHELFEEHLGIAAEFDAKVQAPNAANGDRFVQQVYAELKATR